MIYLGNDLNDAKAIGLSGFSIVPQDSHPKIKEIASYIVPRNGGDQFVRYFIEKIINLEDMNFDQISKLL